MQLSRDFVHTGWVAIFTGTDTQIGRQREVDGWDPATGTALVVDPEMGVRRPVTDYSDFSHLEKASQVVAVLPGGGWHASQRGRGRHDPDSATEPVLAWLVTSIGGLIPVTMDHDGWIGTDHDMNRFSPPDR
ncbi:hypothetical protein ABZ319_11275 [Nocardia sp. NPDC005978]|uniref:hypothetical protein n=1 Tax=Nocardia sp. NPDC005978 TaxID=3156725 RepID=UPI0033B8B17A